MNDLDHNRKNLYRISSAAVVMLLVYSLTTMILLMVIGGQPTTSQEGFAMLQNNRLVAYCGWTC